MSMSLKFAIGSVVGQTTQTHWGQVLVTPHAYGVVELEDPEDARSKGLSLLSKLTESLRDLPATQEDLVSLADKVSDESVKTLLVVVSTGATLQIVLRGEGIVLLKRGQESAVLLNAPGIISGDIQESDTVLLASMGLVHEFAKEEFAAVFDDLKPADAAEKLTMMLHKKEDGAGSAALILRLSGQEEQEAEDESQVLAQPSVPVATYEVSRKPSVNVSTLLEKIKRISERFKKRSFKFKSPNFRILLVIILVCIFLFSVFIGIRKQRAVKTNQMITSTLEQAKHAFEEGVALSELNPIKGRERLNQAKSLLEPLAATVSLRTKEGRQVKELYQKTIENLTVAMHIVKAEPQLFYEVGLLKAGGQASGFAISDRRLAILDRSAKTVFTVNSENKSGEIIAGGEPFNNASFIGYHGDKVHILVDDGVNEVRTTDNKTKTLVIKKDSEWGKIAGLVSFGGNIYLLDQDKSRIWKYIATESGFTERREYLNPDAFPDLKRATGMAIDGSIWIGTEDSTILRFTQGRENTFIPKGVEPTFSGRIVAFTSDDTSSLYVLETQKKRIVALDKDGNYRAQYIWEGNFVPTEFVVSEKTNKILLLSEGKIFSLDLK